MVRSYKIPRQIGFGQQALFPLFEGARSVLPPLQCPYSSTACNSAFHNGRNVDRSISMRVCGRGREGGKRIWIWIWIVGLGRKRRRSVGLLVGRGTRDVVVLVVVAVVEG